MNFSWLPLLGGGLATAVTIAVGANITDLANAFAPAPMPEPTTVYVEQPIVQVNAPVIGGDPLQLPPLVIAVLPPQSSAASAGVAADRSGDNSIGDYWAGGGSDESGSNPDDSMTPPTYSDDDYASGDHDGGDDHNDGHEVGGDDDHEVFDD